VLASDQVRQANSRCSVHSFQPGQAGRLSVRLCWSSAGEVPDQGFIVLGLSSSIFARVCVDC
jgi:hypothetical protein